MKEIYFHSNVKSEGKKKEQSQKWLISVDPLPFFFYAPDKPPIRNSEKHILSILDISFIRCKKSTRKKKNFPCLYIASKAAKISKPYK